MKDTVLQQTPDLFLGQDGSRIRTPAEWNRGKPALRQLIADVEYGCMPPEPEYFKFETCNAGSGIQIQTCKITAGTHEKQLSFELRMFLPKREGRMPVVLTGDGCYRTMNDAVIAEINARGFIAASFDRTMIVRNVYTREEAKDSPLYRVYPQIESGTIAGWAWGFLRCVDALAQMPFVDADNIAVTGHSRGGKTALLAGALDERIAYVAPNGSGGGGTASWRYSMTGYEGPEFEDPRSETLAGMLDMIPHWFGPKMAEYRDREGLLPFDQHHLMALVAPRVLLDTEGYGDIWSNPKGSRQALLAARELYRLFGAEANIVSRYRPGFHDHSPADFRALLDVMECKIAGKPLDAAFYEDPYPGMEPAFGWRCPAE